MLVNTYTSANDLMNEIATRLWRSRAANNRGG